MFWGAHTSHEKLKEIEKSSSAGNFEKNKAIVTPLRRYTP